MFIGVVLRHVILSYYISRVMRTREVSANALETGNLPLQAGMYDAVK